MRVAGVAVAIGLLLVGGATLAERAATSSKARPAPTGLTPDAQKLETAYGQALESTDGRTTKAEWAKYVGTKDSAYQKASTHMPRGMAVTREVKAKDAAKLRQKANDFAADSAMRALRANGAKHPSRADADRWVQAQDAQLAAANAALAARSAEMRQLSEKGDGAGVARVVGQAGFDRAKAVAKGTLDGPPEIRSEADQQKSRDQYVRLMNQMAKRRGGKR
jgi:hypothetical protein